MNIDIWQMIDEVNTSLKDNFLCIPPYQCVNGKFVGDIYTEMRDEKDITGLIFEAITNPSQRAYQMEYRLKKCKIFTPYLSVIEFATYIFMDGNYICAYLSLLPVVEALLRQWGNENPNITFDKMEELTSALTKEIQKKEYYPDERISWANSHINYFQYIICDVFYLSFKNYRKKPFNEIFNRNLSLHILEGVTDFKMCIHNTIRILLVIDVIAELYLMQDFSNYWNCIFYADPEKNSDYQLRWELYKKKDILQ